MGHPAHRPQEVDDLNAVGGHCPRCGSEYRPGFHVCADCNVPLLPGPAPQSPNASKAPAEDPSAAPRDVATVVSLGWEEAWLMAGRLRTAGIDAAVSPDYYAALPYGTRTSFDVLVPADRLREARRVVVAFTRGRSRRRRR